MAAHQSQVDPGGEWPIRTALLAGSVAAVVASLVSLPLRSPHDTLLNTATVTVGALAAALLAGMAWRALRPLDARPIIFSALWSAALALVGLSSLAAEALWLEGAISFVIPLAFIVFAITGIATASLSGSPTTSRWWPAALAVLAAAALGFALMAQGDQKSGRLELPPRAEATAPPSLSWHPASTAFEREVSS